MTQSIQWFCDTLAKSITLTNLISEVCGQKKQDTRKAIAEGLPDYQITVCSLSPQFQLQRVMMIKSQSLCVAS